MSKISSKISSYVLGCDIAKAKIDVSFIDSNGVELWSDQLPNEPLDIAIHLMAIAGNYPGAKLLLVAESTGTYHQTLAETAYSLGVVCNIYNPILTKQQIKASIRGKKTDRTDATIIARLGLRGEGRPYRPEAYKATKYYARSAQKLSGLSSSFKLHHKHMAHLLDDQLSTATQELMIGIQDSITAARKQLNQDMAHSAEGDIFKRLQTITGIGPYVAASLIGEIQDMKRFNTVKALTAYAGLDPRIRQSGHALNNTGRLTKRGSSYLRRSIFIAAGVARQRNPYFKELYDKKRAEGKSYTVAVCVVARKLLAIVRAVWLSGKAYDVNIHGQVRPKST